MKSLLFLLVTFILMGCGGNFRKIQTQQDMQQPYSCAGLHVKYAQWHFTDDFGQNVDVTGRCSKGMRHGQFNFYIDGKMVAKTKYVKNKEVKTSCLALGYQSRTTLNDCMLINLKQTNR